MYAIIQPAYDNADLTSQSAWFAKNKTAVLDYLAQLGCEPEEFSDLIAIQYERQVELNKRLYELQLTYLAAEMSEC